MSNLADKLAAFDAHLPLERARTIPSAWYFDEEIHEAERQRVFASTWQFAARADQLATPGSYVTTTIAGEPVLLVRDDKGELRAFANVCRHKAALVMTEPEGSATRLRCCYHGWTYDLCGQLRGVPEFDGVAEFAREDNGLAPFAVDTCGPLVFVHMGTPNESLADFITPFPERTAALGLEKLQFAATRAYELKCNWKVFVDNYQDGGYHVNTLHPALAGAINYAQYRSENFARGSVQISPLKPSADRTVSMVRSGDNAYYWWIFPNLMINIYEGLMDTNVVLPLGPNRCKVIFDYFFAGAGDPERQQFINDSIAVAHQVQMEDQTICEQVQRGLQSRHYDTGRFSVKREAGGYHFHQLLAAYLRAD